MDIAIRIIANLALSFMMFMSSYILMTKVFHWRVNKVFVILSLVAAALDSVFLTLEYYHVFYTIVWTLLTAINEFNLWIAFCFCIEGKWYKRILVGLATFMLGTLFIDFFTYPLPLYLSEENYNSIPILMLKVLLSGVAILLLYVASFPGRKIKGKRFGTGIIWLITFSILVFDAVVEGVLLSSTVQGENVRRGLRIAVSGEEFLGMVRSSNLLIYFTLVLITFFALFGVNFFMSQRYYRREAEMNANFLDAQAKYYESVQRNNNEIKSLRHDYRNHLTVLALLLENNDVDKAKAYIEDLSGTLKGASSICNTGDQIADAILSEKILKAKSLGVDLKVEGLFSYSDMKAVDTCSILGNILDNAIEAVTRESNSKSGSKSKASKGSKVSEGDSSTEGSDIPETGLSSKEISLVFKKTESFFMISETNLSLNPLNYDGSKVVSSKDNKDLHGMGINNIRTSVERYNGDVDVQCVPSSDRSGEYVFTINIVLPVIG